MKHTIKSIIAAAALCLAGANAFAAVPAGWDSVQATTAAMGIFGTVTVDGVPVSTDNASMLAVFAPGVDRPVGVYLFESASGVDNTGTLAITSIYGLDNATVVPKFAAADNDLLSFAFYDARTGAVLTGPAVTNRGDILGTPPGSLPYADNTTVRFVLNGPFSALDNVTLAFTTPRGGGDHKNFFEKAFGCSAAGGRGPEPLEGALTLLLMVGPALLLRQAVRRRRATGGR